MPKLNFANNFSYAFRNIVSRTRSRHKGFFRMDFWHLQVLLIIGSSCFCVSGQEKSPHIIFILVDDMGWNDVSYNGMNEIYTPNIDALAGDSVLLHNYYVLPVCTPSRGALMTGLYPVRTGLQHRAFWYTTPDALPQYLTLLPERLKRRGYTTRIVGKWHLGFYKRSFTPTFRGFDSHYGYWTGSIDYFQKTSSEIRKGSTINNRPSRLDNITEVFTGMDFREDLRPILKRRNSYVTDLFSEKAVEIISRHNKSKPLFLYVAHLAVHRGNALIPTRSPEKYLQQFDYIRNKDRKHFAGKLKALDESVGTIIEALFRAQMLEDSVVIFSSDNGAPLSGIFRNGGSNWPLRGEKVSLWEGGVRVPGFVWSPKLRNYPRTSDQMMHMVDWLPTLYNAAGGDVKDLGEIDGLNMWPMIAYDQPSPRTGFLVNIDPIDNTSAIRDGDWKLVQTNASLHKDDWDENSGRMRRAPPYPPTSRVLRVLRTFYRNPRFKTRTVLHPIVCAGQPPEKGSRPKCDGEDPCLFNITADPCEYHDLSKKFPEKVLELQKKISDIQTVPPIDEPSDYNADPMLHCGFWDTWLDAQPTADFCHHRENT